MDDILRQDSAGLLALASSQAKSGFTMMKEVPVEPLVRAVTREPWRSVFATADRADAPANGEEDELAEEIFRPPVASQELLRHNKAFLRHLWADLNVPLRDRQAFERTHMKAATRAATSGYREVRRGRMGCRKKAHVPMAQLFADLQDNTEGAEAPNAHEACAGNHRPKRADTRDTGRRSVACPATAPTTRGMDSGSGVAWHASGGDPQSL
eukprot:scaffold797_cov236-Pinguiococcus_pyrenoidosus.AAC.14